MLYSRFESRALNKPWRSTCAPTSTSLRLEDRLRTMSIDTAQTAAPATACLSSKFGLRHALQAGSSLRR